MHGSVRDAGFSPLGIPPMGHMARGYFILHLPSSTFLLTRLTIN